MRMIEALDDITLGKQEQETRLKRKFVIGRINKALNQIDNLVKQIQDLN